MVAFLHPLLYVCSAKLVWMHGLRDGRNVRFPSSSICTALRVTAGGLGEGI